MKNKIIFLVALLFLISVISCIHLKPKEIADKDNDGFGYDIDCNDSNPNINPSVKEECDDGIDNNCNKLVDEGCPSFEELTQVYFNNPLAGLPKLDKLELQQNGMLTAVVKFIESAQSTIDASLHYLGMWEVTNALCDAKKRGVKVRIIFEDDYKNVDIYKKHFDKLSSCGIPIVYDNNVDEFPRICHNKFIVVDNSAVWTGSYNIAYSETYYNGNNSILIQSKKLAEAYTKEFEEMFVNNRWGIKKTDNNDEIFYIGGTKVEFYVSPSDDVQSAIVDYINNAENSIFICMFVITNDTLYNALIKASERGVKVFGVFDQRGSEDPYSDVGRLMSRGMGIIDPFPGVCHHKFAVIDTQIVITGSANWTESGLLHNDENTLIIHNKNIAKLYFNEYLKLKTNTENYAKDTSQPPRVTTYHFNSPSGKARVEWINTQKVDKYRIYRSKKKGCCYEFIAEVDGTQGYYIDENVKVDEGYYYVVTSVTNGKETEQSNEYYEKVKERVMFVEDIKINSIKEGGKSIINVTVKVINENSRPMGEVSVVGHWDGILSGNVSGTTTDKGEVVFTSTTNKSGEVVFTVDNLSHQSYKYSAERNVKTVVRVKSQE